MTIIQLRGFGIIRIMGRRVQHDGTEETGQIFNPFQSVPMRKDGFLQDVWSRSIVR
jgi:hypothetical protein